MDSIPRTPAAAILNGYYHISNRTRTIFRENFNRYSRYGYGVQQLSFQKLATFYYHTPVIQNLAFTYALTPPLVFSLNKTSFVSSLDSDDTSPIDWIVLQSLLLAIFNVTAIGLCTVYLQRRQKFYLLSVYPENKLSRFSLAIIKHSPHRPAHDALPNPTPKSPAFIPRINLPTPVNHGGSPGYRPTNRPTTRRGKSQKSRSTDNQPKKRDREESCEAGGDGGEDDRGRGNDSKPQKRFRSAANRRDYRCPFAAIPSQPRDGRCRPQGKRLDNVRKHLHKFHFNRDMPSELYRARTWNQMFLFCFPEWEGTIPSPFFDPDIKNEFGPADVEFVRDLAQEQDLPPTPKVSVESSLSEAMEPAMTADDLLIPNPCLEFRDFSDFSDVDFFSNSSLGSLLNLKVETYPSLTATDKLDSKIITPSVKSESPDLEMTGLKDQVAPNPNILGFLPYPPDDGLKGAYFEETAIFEDAEEKDANFKLKLKNEILGVQEYQKQGFLQAKDSGRRPSDLQAIYGLLQEVARQYREIIAHLNTRNPSPKSRNTAHIKLTSDTSCPNSPIDTSMESEQTFQDIPKASLLHELIDVVNHRLCFEDTLWSLSKFSARFACPFARICPDENLQCLAINAGSLPEIKNHIFRCHLQPSQKPKELLDDCQKCEDLYAFCGGTDTMDNPYFSFGPLISYLLANTNAENSLDSELKNLKVQQTSYACNSDKDSDIPINTGWPFKSEICRTEDSSWDADMADASIIEPSDRQAIERITSDRNITDFPEIEKRGDNVSHTDSLKSRSNNTPNSATLNSKSSNKNAHSMFEDNADSMFVDDDDADSMFEDTADRIFKQLEKTSKAQAIYMLSILMILRSAHAQNPGTNFTQSTPFQTSNQDFSQCQNNNKENGGNKSSSSSQQSTGQSTPSGTGLNQKNTNGIQKKNNDNGRRRRGPRKPVGPKNLEGLLYFRHKFCCPCAMFQCSVHIKCWIPRKKYSDTIPSLRNHINRDHYDYDMPKELLRENAPDWDDLFQGCVRLCGGSWVGPPPSCSVYTDSRDPETVYEVDKAQYMVAMGVAAFRELGGSALGSFEAGLFETGTTPTHHGPSIPPTPQGENETATSSSLFTARHSIHPESSIGIDFSSPGPKSFGEKVTNPTQPYSPEQSQTSTKFNPPFGLVQNLNLFGGPQINASSPAVATSLANINMNSADSYAEASWGAPPPLPMASHYDISANQASTPYWPFQNNPNNTASSATNHARIFSGASGARGATTWVSNQAGLPSPSSESVCSCRVNASEQSRKYYIVVDRYEDSESPEEESGYIPIEFESIDDIRDNLLERLQARFVAPLFTWEGWKLQIPRRKKYYKNANQVAHRMLYDPPDDYRLVCDVVEV